MKISTIRTYLVFLSLLGVSATLLACGAKVPIKHQPVQFTEIKQRANQEWKNYRL